MTQAPLARLYAEVDAETKCSLQAFRRDHPLKELVLDGVTWEYVSLGQGKEAVLLLHGAAGTCDIWWQQIQALQSDHRVVSVTYPAIKELDDLLRGVVAILAQEGITEANVVGTSLGGYLAQYLIARHPERVRRAVFANTFPPNDILARQYGLLGKLLPLFPTGLVMGVFRRQVEGDIYEASANSELVRAFLLEGSYGPISKARLLSAYGCVLDAYELPDPHALGIPILIVEADNDPLVEPSLRRMLRSAYPLARVQTLQGVGHFPYLNDAGTYTQLLQRFLADEI